MYEYLDMTCQGCMTLSKMQTKGSKRTGRDEKNLQRVFKSPFSGPTKKPKYSSTMNKGTVGSEPEVWFAMISFLLHLRAGRHVEEKLVALLKHFKVTPPLEEGDRTFECIITVWSRSDEIDHTVSKKASTDVVVEAEYWWGLEVLEYLMRTACLARSSFALNPFSEQHSWSHYRFYVNWF